MVIGDYFSANAKTQVIKIDSLAASCEFDDKKQKLDFVILKLSEPFRDWIEINARVS
jgi:hypothetical protein